MRPGQVVKGSYTKIQQAINNANFQNVMDTRSLYNQDQPQDLLSLNYNGVLGTKLFLEGQYSQRHFSANIGGTGATDLINGTLLIDLSRGGTAFRYWAQTFCVCNVDNRDNSEVLAKATYFLSTSRSGAAHHGLRLRPLQRSAAGRQPSVGQRLSNPRDVHGRSRRHDLPGVPEQQLHVHPVGPDHAGEPGFEHPHARAVRQRHLAAERAGSRSTSGCGGTATRVTMRSAISISNSSKLSHRLGVVWDPRGDGKWSINASTGRYVSAINSSIAETSPAGTPSSYTWFYQGPSINPDANAATLVTSDVAIQQVFNWFNANGGANRPLRSRRQSPV